MDDLDLNVRTLNGLTIHHIDGTTASSRLRFASRAGEQYGGKRDIFTVAGYPSEEELDHTSNAIDYYWSQYDRDGVAGRIIDLPPKTCWGTPPEILGPEGEQTAFTDEFAAFADRLGLWRTFERADRLAGLGHYSVLLMGVRGTPDDQALREPIERISSLEDVVLLKPYSERWIEFQDWETSPSDERFGLPQRYSVQLGGGLNAFPDATVSVHHTRLLHIAEDLLEDDLHGRPRLKRAFNRLKDLEKVMAATGEAYWQQADRILQVLIDPEARISEEDLKTLMDQVAEIQHDLRRQFSSKGASLEWLGGVTPDPSGPFEALKELLGAAADIQTRILFGSQSGERASTEDRKAWLGQMSDRQRNHCEPTFVRALLSRLKTAGVPIPDDYTVHWPPLHTESREEIAKGNLDTANTAKALTPVGADPSALVEIDEDGVVSLIPMDADDTADDRGDGREADFLPEAPPALEIEEVEPDDA